MGKPHGANTKAIAEQLKSKLDAELERFKDIKIFYDHGDSLKPEVCQPTTYMGRRYGTDATLSTVDIVVVKVRTLSLLLKLKKAQFVLRRS